MRIHTSAVCCQVARRRASAGVAQGACKGKVLFQDGPDGCLEPTGDAFLYHPHTCADFELDDEEKLMDKLAVTAGLIAKVKDASKRTGIPITNSILWHREIAKLTDKQKLHLDFAMFEVFSIWSCTSNFVLISKLSAHHAAYSRGPPSRVPG